MNNRLIFPVIAKPWFQIVTVLLILADFLIGDLFHSVWGFLLFMGTLTTSAILVLESFIQITFKIGHLIAHRQMTAR